MPKINDDWIVQPHGPLETLDDGLLTVAAEIRMPLGNFPRRMTVVALTGDRVAIWSPVPLDETGMAEIDALGEVAFLIVPGIAHRLDIRAWKARYPDALVVCTQGARKAVEEVIPVDAVGDVFDDPDVTLETVPGVESLEAALHVRREGRLTLLLNDVLANVHHPHGLGAHVMARLMGFGVDRPRMPKVGRKLFVKDAPAVAAVFRRWAADPGLARVVVSHGDVISENPRAALERVAADLET